MILKHYLDMRGLCVCNQWFSSFFTSKPFEYTLELFEKQTDFLKALGTKVIGVSEQGNSIQGQINTPVLPGKPVYTKEEWDKVLDGLEKLAEAAEKKGINLGYHHHMGTGIQTMDEIDCLMKNTKKVKLIYDTGHAAFAGIDPAALLEKYFSRVAHVHLKDIRKAVLEKVKKENMSFLNAVRDGVFTVPGDGMLDYKRVFSILEQNNYKGWLVVEAEQDPGKANPFEYALKARRFIKDNTGI